MHKNMKIDILEKGQDRKLLILSADYMEDNLPLFLYMHLTPLILLFSTTLISY